MRPWRERDPKVNGIADRAVIRRVGLAGANGAEAIFGFAGRLLRRLTISGTTHPDMRIVGEAVGAARRRPAEEAAPDDA